MKPETVNATLAFLQALRAQHTAVRDELPEGESRTLAAFKADCLTLAIEAVALVRQMDAGMVQVPAIKAIMPSGMDVPAVLTALQTMRKGREELLRAVAKKRTWKASEKAMAGADYNRQIVALDFAAGVVAQIPHTPMPKAPVAST